jgi:formylmethanofuran dehydrogenase subunit B
MAVTPIAPATCLGCGCACDDIEIVVRDERIVEARRACPLGVQWFGDGRVPGEVRAHGAPLALEQAIAEAAQLLGAARRALVYLAPDISCEAQRAAVAIADQVHGVVDSVSSSTVAAGILAGQRRGRVAATLGEIRNRADLLVFWGVDPARRYPRYLTRYAPDPAGAFIPEGRRGRTVVAVDIGEERGPADADVRVAFGAEEEMMVLALMRAGMSSVVSRQAAASAASPAGSPAAGATPAGASAAEPPSAGPPFSGRGTLPRARADDTPTARMAAAADELRTRLTGARYGIIVYDAEPTPGAPAGRAEALTALAQQLNATTRCGLSALRAGGNRTGAEAVMTWQTGFPMTVDYSRGVPRYRPDEGANVMLERGEIDVVLIVGDPARAPALRLDGTHRVIIGPRASAATPPADVAIDTGVAGIHEEGIAFRMDDIPLPLRPSLAGPRDAAFVLAALGARLREAR